MSDFMPIEGWDHLELWVGNAKQAAYFYEHAFGFQLTAYAGPETGVRDRASYVIEQGDIRLVLTTALRGDHEIAKHVLAHGDGVKDIALTVPDATQAYREAVQRGARGVTEPHVEEDEHGRVELAAIATYGDTLTRSSTAATTAGRSCRATSRRPATAASARPAYDRPCRRQRRARQDELLGRVLRARLGFTHIIHFDDEEIHTEYSALMSKVMEDGNGKIKFPINEPAEGRRKSQIDEYLEYYGGPGVQHIALPPRTSSPPSDMREPRRRVPRHAERTTRTARRVGEIDEPWEDLRQLGSSWTATRTATCCRSSPRRLRTGRPSSSRSSSARARAASARATSRRSSKRSSANRRLRGNL